MQHFASFADQSAYGLLGWRDALRSPNSATTLPISYAGFFVQEASLSSETWQNVRSFFWKIKWKARKIHSRFLRTRILLKVIDTPFPQVCLIIFFFPKKQFSLSWILFKHFSDSPDIKKFCITRERPANVSDSRHVPPLAILHKIIISLYQNQLV